MGATDILYEVAMLMTAGLTSRRRFQAFDRTVSENDTVFFFTAIKIVEKKKLKNLARETTRPRPAREVFRE
jgi:hypothetical protein